MSGFSPVGSVPVGSIGQAGPSLVVIWTTAPTDSDVGQVISWAASASGGTPAYTYSVSLGALPSGLSLNSSTGAITGTITGDSATYSFTILATDSLGVTGSIGTTVVIFNPAYANRVIKTERQRFIITYRKRHKPWIVPRRSTKKWASINASPVRITWAGVEVANSGTPAVQITWAGTEVANSGAPLVRITWAGVEVARSISSIDIFSYGRPKAMRFLWNRKLKHRVYRRPKKFYISATAPVITPLYPYKRSIAIRFLWERDKPQVRRRSRNFYIPTATSRRRILFTVT